MKYRSLALTAAEITWLTFLLRHIDIFLHKPPQLFFYNISALHMYTNLVFHARSKYIEIDYHFVGEKVAIGAIVTCYMPTTLQVADAFTEPLASILSLDFVAILVKKPFHTPH